MAPLVAPPLLCGMAGPGTAELQLGILPAGKQMPVWRVYSRSAWRCFHSRVVGKVSA